MTTPDLAGEGADDGPAFGNGPVPILAYHDVSPKPHPAFRRYSVTVNEFARQMRWLAVRGYQPIDMDALFAARSGRAPLPGRPVLITFDDGFQSCVDHAVPVLESHGFTAMFYLVTGLMGASSRWMAADPGVDLPLISWDVARQLVAAGHQCGAHSVTHPSLTALEGERRRAELVDGRRRMEDELGRTVVHFAYPFGAYDASTREDVARAGYVTACSTRPGLSPPDDDLLALHRITVHGGEPFVTFRCRVSTGRGVRDATRAALGGWLRRLTPRAGS
jgi:peptidoglycan/xylan/chitin deacetylase (PgdA/CDA1 family)